jgi:hypothetical protein
LISSVFLAAKSLVLLSTSCIAAVFFLAAAVVFEKAFEEGRDNDSEVYIIVAVMYFLVAVTTLLIALWTAFTIRTQTFWIGMCFVAIALVFPPYETLFGEWAAALHGAFASIAALSAVMWYSASKDTRKKVG